MKKLTRKQILKNAESRLKEMKMELIFSENVYQKRPTEHIGNKIELLKEDILELEGEIKIFKKEDIL